MWSNIRVELLCHLDGWRDVGLFGPFERGSQIIARRSRGIEEWAVHTAHIRRRTKERIAPLHDDDDDDDVGPTFYTPSL